MNSILIISLFFLDIILLGAIIFVGRRQSTDNGGLLTELSEERKYLTDLRTSLKEELEGIQRQGKAVLKQVSQIATEAEMEVKSSGDTLAKEMEDIVDQLSEKFHQPLEELSKQKKTVNLLLRRLDREKLLLNKAIERGEKLSKFFNDKVPYEELIDELQDKKYKDARLLIAKGHKPESIAIELGLSKSEVKLIAGVG